jgi:hypothetical protein
MLGSQKFCKKADQSRKQGKQGGTIRTLATIPWDSAYRPVLEGKFKSALRKALSYDSAYIRAQWLLERFNASEMDNSMGW